MSFGQVDRDVRNTVVTATWQLPTFPRVPEYCRFTPTECFPCLGKPVSSMMRTPLRSGIVSRNTFQRSRGSQGECVMKCWSA